MHSSFIIMFEVKIRPTYKQKLIIWHIWRSNELLSRCEFLSQRRPFNHGFTRCQIKESRWRCYLPYSTCDFFFWQVLIESKSTLFTKEHLNTRKGHLNQVCYCYNIFISKLINSLLLLLVVYYGRKPRKWDCFVIKVIDFCKYYDIIWRREEGNNILSVFPD